MSVIKWFLWRRWAFIRAISQLENIDTKTCMVNLTQTNFSNCRNHSSIWFDICRIVVRQEILKNGK